MKQILTFKGKNEEELKRFIVEARLSLKSFRRVVVNSGGTTIFDINRNEIRLPGISYKHDLLFCALREAGASFDPNTLREAPPNEEKSREYRCSARYAWGQDRIA
jgi:hypothetical protein